MMKLLLIELLSFATVVMCAYGGRSNSPTMYYQVQQDQIELAEMFKEHNEKAMNAVISPYKIFLQKIDTIMTDLKRRHESMVQHQRIIDIHRQMMNSVEQSHVRLRYNYVYFMVDALLPVLAHLERSEHYVSVARDLKEAIQELQEKVDDLGHECQKVGVSYSPRLYKEFVNSIAVPDIGKYSITVWERYFDGQYRCFVQNIVHSSEETLNSVEASNMYANLALMVRYKVYLKYIEQLNEEVKKECSAEVLGKKYNWFEISGSDLSVVVERANKPSSDWTKKYEALYAEAYRMVCSHFKLENEPTIGLIRYAKVCNYACYLDANASMPLWDACLEISQQAMREELNKARFDLSRSAEQQQAMREELDQTRFDLSRSAKQQQAMREELDQTRIGLSRSAKQQQAMREELNKARFDLSRSAKQQQAMEEESDKVMSQYTEAREQRTEAAKQSDDFLKREQRVPTKSSQQLDP